MAREARQVVIYSHGYGLTRLQPMNHDRAAQARGLIRVECNRCRRCPTCVAVDKRSGDLRGLRPRSHVIRLQLNFGVRLPASDGPLQGSVAMMSLTRVVRLTPWVALTLVIGGSQGPTPSLGKQAVAAAALSISIWP